MGLVRCRGFIQCSGFGALLTLAGGLIKFWREQRQKNREPFLTKQLEAQAGRGPALGAFGF
jgi:hypothetical protein